MPGKVQRLCQARRAEHTHADLEENLIIIITIIIVIVIVIIIIIRRVLGSGRRGGADGTPASMARAESEPWC